MKKSILKLGKALKKTDQQEIKGGLFWPRTERNCQLCGGEWDAPLCALPYDSVCL